MLKSKFLFLLSLIPSISLFSQEVQMWDGVPVILDAYAHKVSPDGTFSSGEVVSSEAAWGRDNITGQVYFFSPASLGDGNNITKDHIMVGTDKANMKGAFLVPGEGSRPILVSSLQKYSESYVHGITWEGTRLVGFMANPGSAENDETDPSNQKMSYLPFYCDIVPGTLEVSDPVFLPVPPYDFFGHVPQYCTAFWISDDASTILGQVIDNSGFFIYPIVYKQAANGEWSYSLPSEKLFNPKGLEIPKWPVPKMRQPQAENFIGNPEFKALFIEMLNAYITGESTDNPYLMLNPSEAGSDALMTEDEWISYQEALMEYDSYYYGEYEEEVNKYYEEYSKFISQTTNFLQSSMAMNRAGTRIGQTKIVTRFSGVNPITYENPVIFNLEDESYKIYGDDYDELGITQILPDGTLLGVTAKPGPTTPDLTPQHSLVCAPGNDSFITIEDYIKTTNSDYYDWYMKYLKQEVPIGYTETGEIAYKDMTVSGLVAASDDFSVIVGGVDGWAWNFDSGEFFSYIFSNVKSPDAGIENIIDNPMGSSIKVFNLQGMEVLNSSDINEIQKLTPGIYIINGKKIYLK